jgi:hypothetical protein
MKTQIRISAKTLGSVALPNFCPCCFWIRMRCGDKLPFQIFPGIFSSIDSYSKKVTSCHFHRHGRVPGWFDGFGELGAPIRVPHWSKFQMIDNQTNILLTGVPDELLRHPKRGLWIGDYKCARFTDTQDELAPMYEVQLNAYATIASRIGLGPVYGLGLLYYEPLTELPEAALELLTVRDGFAMRFSPKLLPIKLDPAIIPRLLQRVREICDLPTRPEGRLGCRDCALLDALVIATVGRAAAARRSVEFRMISSVH